jgi:hypothetical protein
MNVNVTYAADNNVQGTKIARFYLQSMPKPGSI